MTAEEFLSLLDRPDDGVDRQLIDGIVWERPHAFADRRHGLASAAVATKLAEWADAQPGRWGCGSGGVGMRLPGGETVVGPDAALFDPAAVAAQPPPPRPGGGLHVWHGAPRVAVEVVSPGDDAAERGAVRAALLAASVPQVWELITDERTVAVYRHNAEPAVYSDDQTLPGDPDLPGFVVRAGDLFGG